MAFNLADLFEIVADVCPDREALVAPSAMERRLTYRELDERANRVAHHLIDAGVRPGEHVAVYSWNRAEWFEAQLGIYKARSPVINVNYRYIADELGYMLENSDSTALLFERSLAPVVAQVRDHCPNLRHLVVIDDHETQDAADKEVQDEVVAELGALDYEDALAAASPDRDFGPRSADDVY